jgi:hypothetical protein
LGRHSGTYPAGRGWTRCDYSRLSIGSSSSYVTRPAATASASAVGASGGASTGASGGPAPGAVGAAAEAAAVAAVAATKAAYVSTWWA